MTRIVNLLTIVTILTVVASFYLPFIYWPEMLNWPFFLHAGWQPYKDFYVIHTPLLIYSLLAFYRILGFKIVTLHIFGTLLIVVSIIILAAYVYSQTRSRLNSLVASLAFLLLSLAFGGNTVWFESFLAPVLLTLYIALATYLKDPRPIKILPAGILFGIALVSKQTAAYLLPAIAFAPITLYLHGRRRPEILTTIIIFILSSSLVAGLFLVWLSLSGLLPDFLYWGVQFVFHKPFSADVVNSYVLYPSIKQFLSLIILLTPVIVVTLKQRKPFQMHILVWVLFSLLFAFPRFNYFHLIPTAIFIALFIGESFSVKTNQVLYLISLAIVLLMAIVILRNTLRFTHTFVDPETEQLVQVLNNKFPGKTIFSLNGPDQVYFLTGRLPAVRPWIPQLAWYLEPYGNKFARDFQAGSPDVIFYSPYLAVPIQGVGAYRPQTVTDYVAVHYHLSERLASGIEILTKD